MELNWHEPRHPQKGRHLNGGVFFEQLHDVHLAFEHVHVLVKIIGSLFLLHHFGIIRPFVSLVRPN